MVLHTRQSFCYLIAAKKTEELRCGAHTDSYLAVVVILFGLLSKFARFCLRKDKKNNNNLHYNFRMFFYLQRCTTF